MGENDARERSRGWSTGVPKQIHRKSDAAIRRNHDARAADRRVNRGRRRGGVQVEIRDVASEDRVAIVEGGRVGPEILAAVNGAEESRAGRHQQNVASRQHDAIDSHALEQSVCKMRPSFARVGRTVNPNGFRETCCGARFQSASAAVEGIAGAGINDVGIVRIQGDSAHRERRHEVGLRQPGRAAIERLPYPSVVGGDVDHLVGRATRVNGDVHDFA